MRPEKLARSMLLTAALFAPASAGAQEYLAGPTVYGRLEALQWRIQDAPLPVPLLTTTQSAANGTVGDPNTHILLGTDSLDLGVRNGCRFTAGAWLDPGETYGVEGSVFFLRRFGTSRMFSDASGDFRLGMPYFDVAASVPAVYPLSGPSFSTPSRTIFIPQQETTITIPGITIPGASAVVGFDTHSQLCGYDLNGMMCACVEGPFRLELLGGYRYLRLREDLLLLASSTSQPANGDVFTTSDSFTTRNNFYGGQVGARVVLDGGFVFADVTGKVAAGPMVERVNVAGSLMTTAFDPATHGASVFPGGVYAQRSNIGETTATRCAVVSELQANVGVQCGPVRAFVGYTCLYVTSVARAGNQIDPGINPNQSEAILRSANPPGVGFGPYSPERTVTSSSFWAQGISVGLELRY